MGLNQLVSSDEELECPPRFTPHGVEWYEMMKNIVVEIAGVHNCCFVDACCAHGQAGCELVTAMMLLKSRVENHIISEAEHYSRFS